MVQPSRRRRRFALVALALLVTIALWLTGNLVGWFNRISIGNFEQIHAGMSRDEVETILGTPGTVQDLYDAADRNRLAGAVGEWVRRPNLVRPGAAACVYFDEGGRVTTKTWYAHGDEATHLRNVVRYYLGI